jgi:ABC-type dipeptide/oligopeptide/nickel transport system permease component
MLHFLPGDPVLMMLTEHAGQQAPSSNTDITPEQYENMRHALGLDQPLHVQYGQFLWRALQGDLGKSFRTQAPVTDMIVENLPYTFTLAMAGLGVSVALGLVLGIIAAINRDTWIDGATMTLAVASISMPNFWFGIMLLLIFALQLKLLPAVGPPMQLKSLILPAVALGFRSSASVARLMRSSLVEVVHEDYVRTARAKGLKERAVILRHALKNALIPVVTIVGLQFGGMLSGTTIIETVFARPGIGRLAVSGVVQKDFPLIQGTILFTAFIYVLANFLVDLSYAWLDPRVRYE